MDQVEAHREESWLEQIHPNGRRRGPEFALGEAALLVLDLQRYFLDPGSHAFVPAAGSILHPVKRIAALFAAQQRPVVFTRHVDPPDTASPMRRWWKDALHADDPRAELAIEPPARTAALLDKPHYDAFLGTGLEDLLRGSSVRQVVVCGVQTHLCVETTARAAFCRGFSVYLPADTTAAKEDRFRHASLLNLSHGFAWIGSSAELIEAAR